MQSKRGQVTLFVIIAIAIVVIALVAFLIYNQNKTKTESQTVQVKSYLTEALKQKILLNILKVTYQGGQDSLSNNSFVTPFYDVPYWIDNNKLTYPTIEEVTQSIDNLNEKINNLNLKRGQTYTMIFMPTFMIYWYSVVQKRNMKLAK